MNVAVFGTAGSMRSRVINALKDDPGYRMLYVESGGIGQARLQESVTTPTSHDEAIGEADVVIFAVPDTVVGPLAREIVPSPKAGTLVVTLDPAAAYGGELPEKEGISYFVTHPAQSPICNDETEPEARRDCSGSGKAKPGIVNAPMSGPDEDYARARRSPASCGGRRCAPNASPSSRWRCWNL